MEERGTGTGPPQADILGGVARKNAKETRMPARL